MVDTPFNDVCHESRCSLSGAGVGSVLSNALIAAGRGALSAYTAADLGRPLNNLQSDLPSMNATTFLSEAVRSLSLSAVTFAVSLSAWSLQAADNQPPLVTVTSPTTGDLFPVGAEALIAATVEDPDGSVTNVEFFANGVSLGAIANPVFAIGLVWNISAAGAYSLKVTATDNLGKSTTSSDVNVQVISQPFVWIEAADPNAAEGNPADPGKLTVKRWGLTTEPLTVFYQAAGTATAGSDYLALSGSVTIPAGAAAADIVVTPLADGQVEPPETVVVQLLDDPGYRVVEPLKAQVTIAGDQGANVAPTVTMVAPIAGAKFSAPATILLKARAEDTDGTVTGVSFYRADTVIGPGIADASDPKLFSRQWTAVPTGSYVVSALATDNAGATKRSATVAFEVVSLPVVTIAVADGTAKEGTPATDTARLVVSRNGDTTAALVVHYQVSGTATAGNDYVALSGTVEIPAGQADAGIVVVPIDDQLVESTESLLVELKVPTVGPGEPPPYAIGVPGRAEVSIVDNDSPTPLPVVTVVAADATAIEPSPEGVTDTATFVIQRTGGTDRPLTVTYKISGTAQNGIDYENLSGAVIIPVGAETVRVILKPLADGLKEDAETVVIELQEPSCVQDNPSLPGCYQTGDLHSATATILDWTAGNRAPRVELVKPLSQQNFQFPEAINLVAAASDIDGLVTKVEFWADGAKVGNQTAPSRTTGQPDIEPVVFTFAWTGAQPGRHVLKAVAFDNGGASAASSEVPILVITGELPPLVSVSATDAHAALGPSRKHPNTATFKVQRTGKLDRPLTVWYSLAGTAKNGQDYLKLPGSVNIPAGKSNTRITVVPMGNLERDSTKTVILHLEPPPAGLAADLYRLDRNDTAAASIADDRKGKSGKGRLPKDVFQVSLPGENGKPYRVDVSDDLIHWTTVTDTLAEGGQVEFLQPDMSGFTRRFYRIHPVVVEALDPDD